MGQISGFSKLSKQDKIEWLRKAFLPGQENLESVFASFYHSDDVAQKHFEEFSENTLTNFFLPYGVAPNFKINKKFYCVPMVIEESSVVAAAGRAAKFWSTRGGIEATILSTHKVGQVHFLWAGPPEKLKAFYQKVKQDILLNLSALESNMKARGGGILDITLKDQTHLIPNYYQLFATFNTCDAMGANFINTILEFLARSLKEHALEYPEFQGEEKEVEVVMSILSNYTPECVVKVSVSSPIAKLAPITALMPPDEYARRFQTAIRIAEVDPYRATTHNKGIFNGIDAVVCATGNDFRATEACGHAYAARSGQYRSLSQCRIEGKNFHFELTVPLSLGTIGGITSLHPLAKLSLEMLGNPSAPELMQIAASVGLMQNFAAITSLVTTGIQKGHMRMHLKNILRQENATEDESQEAITHFSDKTVSYNAVRNFLQLLRTKH